MSVPNFVPWVTESSSGDHEYLSQSMIIRPIQSVSFKGRQTHGAAKETITMTADELFLISCILKMQYWILSGLLSFKFHVHVFCELCFTLSPFHQYTFAA